MIEVELMKNNLYVNIIVVRKGEEDFVKIKVLMEVFYFKEIKDFIEKKYDGVVFFVFE